MFASSVRHIAAGEAAAEEQGAVQEAVVLIWWNNYDHNNYYDATGDYIKWCFENSTPVPLFFTRVLSACLSTVIQSRLWARFDCLTKPSAIML